MSELKPCPFCGGEAELLQTNDNHGKWFVRCRFGVQYEPKCPASRLVLWDYNSRDDAIESWNKRVDAKPVVHGKWMDVYHYYGNMPYRVTGIHECSVCEYQFEFDGEYKYCPNCGADMRGKADE